MASLDFSADKGLAASDAPLSPQRELDVQALMDQASLGTRTSEGMYEVKDWEFAHGPGGADDLVAQALAGSGVGAAAAEEKKGGMGVLGGLFARLTGSKTLTEEDLKPVLEAMKQRLMQKNVAMEISEKVCEGVGEGLVGKKIGSFQSASFPSAYMRCGLIENIHGQRSTRLYARRLPTPSRVSSRRKRRRTCCSPFVQSALHQHPAPARAAIRTVSRLSA